MQGKEKLIDLLDKNPARANKTLSRLVEDNISTLINDYGPENLGRLKSLNSIESVFYKYDTDAHKKKYNEIAKLIMIKDYISEAIWYILSGILVINITNNYILEQTCL